MTNTLTKAEMKEIYDKITANFTLNCDKAFPQRPGTEQTRHLAQLESKGVDEGVQEGTGTQKERRRQKQKYVYT